MFWILCLKYGKEGLTSLTHCNAANAGLRTIPLLAVLTKALNIEFIPIALACQSERPVSRSHNVFYIWLALLQDFFGIYKGNNNLCPAFQKFTRHSDHIQESSEVTVSIQYGKQCGQLVLVAVETHGKHVCLLLFWDWKPRYAIWEQQYKMSFGHHVRSATLGHSIISTKDVH